MKKSVLFFILLIAVTFHARAQEIAPPAPGDRHQIQSSANQVLPDGTSIGQLLIQLAESLTDDALTPSFKKGKSKFLKQTSQITDYTAGAQALESLQSGIVKEAMTAEWKEIEGEWIRDARSVANMRQLTGITSVFERNITDRYFKPEWQAQRATWQATLNQISRK